MHHLMVHYGPETLKIVFQSFDQAWGSIAHNFGDNPLAIQAARAKLAPFSAYRTTIKASALQMMARDHRTGINSG